MSIQVQWGEVPKSSRALPQKTKDILSPGQDACLMRGRFNYFGIQMPPCPSMHMVDSCTVQVLGFTLSSEMLTNSKYNVWQTYS